MTGSSGEPGGYEVVVRRATEGQVWRERLRAVGRVAERGGRSAGHGGRLGLIRLRAYLRTPAGRQAATRTMGALAVVAAVFGGFTLVRGWLASAGARLAAAGAAFRAAAGAMGAAARALRFVLPFRALGRMLRWSTLTATFRMYGPCPDCHSRIHSDARVCYRCGHRFSRREANAARRRRGRGFARSRRGFAGVRWFARVALLRLYRGCPDCRRLVHADARVCWHCGCRVRG